MSKKSSWIVLGIAVAAAIVVPDGAFAETVDTYGSAAMQTQATTIQGFLFGVPMKIIAILGGAYGLFQAFVSATVRPLLTYGGISLGAGLVPTFINGVFNVAGLLLP